MKKYELIEINVSEDQNIKTEVNMFLQNEGRIVINITMIPGPDGALVYLLMENRETSL